MQREVANRSLTRTAEKISAGATNSVHQLGVLRKYLFRERSAKIFLLAPADEKSRFSAAVKRNHPAPEKPRGTRRLRLRPRNAYDT